MCKFDVIIFLVGGGGEGLGPLLWVLVYMSISLSLYVYEGSTMKTSP